MNKHCPESIEKDMLTLKRQVITQVNGVFHAYRLIKHMAVGDVVVDFTEPALYRPWYNKHRIRESDSKTREYARLSAESVVYDPETGSFNRFHRRGKFLSRVSVDHG